MDSCISITKRPNNLASSPPEDSIAMSSFLDFWQVQSLPKMLLAYYPSSHGNQEIFSEEVKVFFFVLRIHSTFSR
jgi:hypothetical protein